MPVEVGDILRVALQWFADGSDEQVNVHHVKVDDVGTAAGDAEFMDGLAQAFLETLYAQVIVEVADSVVGAIMSGFNVTKSETLPPVTNPMDGGQTTDHGYARQVTALVYMNTNVARRQGRSYLPTFTEDAIDDDGGWRAGILTVLGDYAIGLLSPITDGNVEVHRVVTHTDGSSPLEISYAGVGAYPRTQRRRTPGFGS